jgi:hypothetical protein
VRAVVWGAASIEDADTAELRLLLERAGASLEPTPAI